MKIFLWTFTINAIIGSTILILLLFKTKKFDNFKALKFSFIFLSGITPLLAGVVLVVFLLSSTISTIGYIVLAIALSFWIIGAVLLAVSGIRYYIEKKNLRKNG